MQRNPLAEAAAFCSAAAIAIAAVAVASLAGVEQLFDSGRASSMQVSLRAAALGLCMLNLPLWLHAWWYRGAGKSGTIIFWTYPITQLFVILAMAVLGAMSALIGVPL